MRVLLVGKGGREHALAWKISRSRLLTRLYLWPAGPAIAPLGETLDLPQTASFAELVEMSRKLGIDMVVSGPEAPLSQGLADAFAKVGIPTFGPVQAVAELEASKAFAKAMMRKAGIPTAAYHVVSGEAECRQVATEMLAKTSGAVLKASGLAAGKGVFVCRTVKDVEEGLKHLYHSDMRTAASTVVVEELLEGRECSYFSFIGKGGATGLGFAVDYKRLGDGDLGPNTGGMGCYAPVPWIPADAEKQVVAKVIEPLQRALAAEGLKYQGCLYVGLMWSESKGPMVVEFNVRLGDPEAQVLAAYDDRDWLAVMAAKCGLPVPEAAVQAATAPITHGERAVAVVMASHSYPFGSEAPEAAPLPLAWFARGDGAVKVFAASVTPSGDGEIKTASGRVLTVTARAKTFAAARELAYAKVAEIGSRWRGARWRQDIAMQVTQADGG